MNIHLLLSSKTLVNLECLKEQRNTEADALFTLAMLLTSAKVLGESDMG